MPSSFSIPACVCVLASEEFASILTDGQFACFFLKIGSLKPHEQKLQYTPGLTNTFFFNVKIYIGQHVHLLGSLKTHEQKLQCTLGLTLGR